MSASRPLPPASGISRLAASLRPPVPCLPLPREAILFPLLFFSFSFFLFLSLFLFLIPSARAQTPAPDDYHAGLIVIGPDGERRDYCVAFPEETITGEQLLSRAGLEVNADLGN